MHSPHSSCRLTADEPRSCHRQADGQLRLMLPPELGHCYTENLQLEPGLQLGHLHYQPTRALIEESNGPHTGRVVVITIGLEGESFYQSKHTSTLRFQAGHTTITAFQAHQGERLYHEDKSVSQLRLVVNESTLDKYIGPERSAQFLGRADLHQVSFHASSQATLEHAATIRRHMRTCAQNQEPPQRLHLQIHALSLLAEQVKLLAPAPHAQSGALNDSDIARLEQARQILRNQMHETLTVSYLATTVGINEHKLKTGFKLLYDTTPMGLLLQFRMLKAHALLESGLQVAQTAWQVGYPYPNNFSVAFTRYFGYSPKSVFGKQTS